MWGPRGVREVALTRPSGGEASGRGRRLLGCSRERQRERARVHRAGVSCAQAWRAGFSSPGDRGVLTASPSLGNHGASLKAFLSHFLGSGCPVLERLVGWGGMGSGPPAPDSASCLWCSSIWEGLSPAQMRGLCPESSGQGEGPQKQGPHLPGPSNKCP